MSTEKEILEIINEIYPKEKRCGNSMFDYGLFVRGFIEGFQKSEQLLTKIHDEEIASKIKLSFKKAKEVQKLRNDLKDLQEKYKLSQLR